MEISFGYIVIPFEILVEKYESNDKQEYIYNSTKILNEWFTFNLFTKLLIGDPNQNVSVHIDPRKSCFELNRIYIEGVELDKLSYFFPNEEKTINLSLFNLNKSNTFKDVTSQYPKFNNYNYLMGNDEIYFYNSLDTENPRNLIKPNTLHFRVNKNNYGGIDCNKEKCGLQIGIKVFDQEDDCPNFNKELKKSNLTNKYIFSIHYNSQYSGFLIFGAYPHEYFPDKYKEEQLSKFYTSPDSIEITNFNIIADDIISINYEKKEWKISNQTKLIFELYYGFFVGAYSYKLFIEENFFNNLIEKKICFKSNNTVYGSVMYFDVYSCNEESLNDIKKFPELKFYIKSTNTSFIFNYNDLFKKIGNKYYFMVIFEKYKNSYWQIGYPFFKKYDIVFDDDSKTIGYYNSNIEINDNKGGNQTVKIVLIVLLTIIVFCGLLAIGYYIGKEKYIQRKKRANELNDDYDYKINENIINNNEENTSNKIINND